MCSGGSSSSPVSWLEMQNFNLTPDLQSWNRNFNNEVIHLLSGTWEALSRASPCNDGDERGRWSNVHLWALHWYCQVSAMTMEQSAGRYHVCEMQSRIWSRSVPFTESPNLSPCYLNLCSHLKSFLNSTPVFPRWNQQPTGYSAHNYCTFTCM